MWITAVAGSTLSPSVATLPSTVTMPSAMNPSHSRRDPRPALASTFCSRSTRAGGGGASGAGSKAEAGKSVSDSALGIGNLVYVVGEEGSKRRQLVDAVQAQLLQEQRGRPVEERAALRLAATLFDQAARHERANHPVAVHAPDRGNPRAGHRLLVGHHRQRLERRLRQAYLLPIEHELLDVGGVLRPRIQPPTAGD